MIAVHIPGQDPFELNHLVLDFNGTIALDGRLLDEIKARLIQLSEQLALHVITADTNGTVAQECSGLPVAITVIAKHDQIGEKTRFIESLRPRGAAAIGNGANDAGMFRAAELAVAVMGEEGCAVSALTEADILVTRMADALDLILMPHRLTATLRI